LVSLEEPPTSIDLHSAEGKAAPSDLFEHVEESSGIRFRSPDMH
jgi:hypothetical protein